MRPLHALVLVGAVPVLVVAGCQLVTGVDTIEYATGTGGASTSVTGISAQSSTGATMSSTAESSSSSSVGTGGGCGDGTCDPAKENACTSHDDCATALAKKDNGCCEKGESTLSKDCAAPFCDPTDGVCSANESCEHCGDCGVDSHGVQPTCAKSCKNTAECEAGQASSSSGFGPEPECCSCAGIGFCSNTMTCGYLVQHMGCLHL